MPKPEGICICDLYKEYGRVYSRISCDGETVWFCYGEADEQVKRLRLLIYRSGPSPGVELLVEFGEAFERGNVSRLPRSDR
jgi:hypothetical protein